MTFLQNKFLKNKFLKKDSSSFAAVNLGSCYLKGLIVKNGEIRNYFLEKNDNLPATLKKVWEEKRIPTRSVKLSIKNPSCLVRYFPFPKMDKKRLSQALTYELNKFIPFSFEEVYFDFFILKEINPSEVYILLAVVKRDFVNQILEIFSQANLDIANITLDSICLINLFLNNYTKSKEINSCILDIGNSISTITIFNKETPFLTRDVKFSTKEVLDSVSRTKNLDSLAVQEWIKDDKNNTELIELAQHNISNLCREIKSSLDYFEVNAAERIDSLYLTGGLSSTKGLEKAFTKELEVNTEVLKVFDGDKVKSNIVFSDQKFVTLENYFSVAFGLAL
jgi:type IV pilus assembly protein PilM